MNKKIIFIFVGLVVLGTAYWLVSPFWRNVKLDEAIPQTQSIKDNMDSMDQVTKNKFEQEVLAMEGEVMIKSESMPSSPKILGEAKLVPRAHDVSGKALIVDVGGEKIVRFENLKTINGPDLRIYLSSDLGIDDAIDLGAIRATEGNVNYTLPSGVDTTKYKNVLIWCRTFGVLFSYAEI